MKTVIKLLVLASILSALSLSVIGQKRASKPKQAAPSSSSVKAVCKGDAIPKGFVIVAVKSSERCDSSVEFTAKKPIDTEAVCDGSPIPDGYSVVRQGYVARCDGSGSNPLNNAMLIRRDGVSDTSTSEFSCPGGEAKLGMTPKQVLGCVGRLPKDAVRSITADGETYVVIFDVGQFTFHNGKLTKIVY